MIPHHHPRMKTIPTLLPVGAKDIQKQIDIALYLKDGPTLRRHKRDKERPQLLRRRSSKHERRAQA